jgi:hypothetical protein
MIDRAQLEGERTPAGFRFRACERGHAADHGWRVLSVVGAQYAMGQPGLRATGRSKGCSLSYKSIASTSIGTSRRRTPHFSPLPSALSLTLSPAAKLQTQVCDSPMTTSPRPSGRAHDELRVIGIERNYTRHAEGSVLIACGDTRVLCTASIEEKVPPFLRGKGEGWVRPSTACFRARPRSARNARPRAAARRAHDGDPAPDRPRPARLRRPRRARRAHDHARL